MNDSAAPRRDPVVPSALPSLLAVMAVTWKRLVRGRALYVAGFIALLPVAVAAIVSGYHVPPQRLQHIVLRVEQLTLCLLPAMFIASSIGEDIEDRTTTYLWSRPVARWVVLIGKLGTLVPVIVAIAIASWVAANGFGSGAAPSVASCIALGGGTLALALVAAGIATLAPRHGMALTIGYLAILDLFFGFLPLSIRHLSVMFHQRVLIELVESKTEAAQAAAETASSVATSSLALVLIGGVWLAIGLWRIRRLEA